MSSNLVSVYPDDFLSVSLTTHSLSHGTSVGSYSATITGNWGSPDAASTGVAYATFVSLADSGDYFTYRWDLGSNTGNTTTVSHPTVLDLSTSDNVGKYYLKSFAWNTSGPNRDYSASFSYTPEDNAGTVDLYPNPSSPGIYQYGTNNTVEGVSKSLIIVDPDATLGETKNYTITGSEGFNEADITTPLTGTITFTGVYAFLSITPSIDNAEDPETLILNIDGYSAYSILIGDTPALRPSSPTFEADADGYTNLTNNGKVLFTIPSLASGMTWSYSIDGGINWIEGDSTSGLKEITLPDGVYAGDAIQVRTVDINGVVALSSPEDPQKSHTVDQTPPETPDIKLAEDSGNTSDLLTRNGRVNISGLETDATWFYSLDSGAWISGSNDFIEFEGDGAKSIRIKQIDLAGNVSPVATLAFTLDSSVLPPTLSLQEDSGISGDLLTRNGRVNISGLETGATWLYSLDGDAWLNGTSDFIEFDSDGTKSFQIKQVDLAENVSEVISLTFTLDSFAQRPTLSLQEDTGIENDLITRNGRVNITGLETGASWLYSLDGDAWINGSGEFFEFESEGTQSIQIKQVDLAGNTSEVSTFTFTLEASAQRPILTLQEDTGIANDLITSNGRVNIAGLSSGATWFYALDGGAWITGTGEYIDLVGDGTKSLQIIQTDLSGNTSDASTLVVNVDSTVETPLLTLQEDSGVPGDLITRNGRVNISGLEVGASWSYSLNNIDWSLGSGSSLQLSGDGQKSLWVKQVDLAGNISSVTNIDFELDTVSVDPNLSISQDQNIRTSIISGFASPSRLVKITVGSAIFSTVSDSNTGAWEINLFARPNISGEPLQMVRGRDVLVEATVLDQAGNSSESVLRRIVPHLNSLPSGSIEIEAYTGAFNPGSTLIAKSKLFDIDGMDEQDMTYRWQADGIDIVNAGSSRYYQIRETDLGKSIRAIGSYIDYSGTLEQVVSASSSVIRKQNSFATGSVFIEGLNGNDQPITIKQNQTLLAIPSLNDDDGVGPINYQWYTDGAPIAGANSERFTPSTNNVKQMLSVVARFKDGLGYEESVWSNQFLISLESTPTAPIQIPNTVSYQVPISAIQSIGLSPDGQYLLIKINGNTTKVSRDETLDFADLKLTANDLTNQITPTPVFRSSGGTGGYTLPEIFTGPASLNLQYQLIENADNAVVIGGTTNDFIKVSSTNSLGKAVNGGGGSDVIDGGVGSTFVSGGINHFGSTFFLDGRAPGTSWSTITDFQRGSDKATIWGWKQGISKVSTAFADFNSGGAEGFKGLTLHFENLLPDDAAPGQTNSNLNSITLSGLTLADFGASSISELNTQIASGTSRYFQTGLVSDAFGDHGYLLLS